jgi:SAM-dependent methyltransferase
MTFGSRTLFGVKAPDAINATVSANYSEFLTGVRGVVLEIGCGSWTLLPYYPPEVTQIIGVEPDLGQRERAFRRAANQRKHEWDIVDLLAEEKMPIPTESVDFVTFSDSICSIRKPDLLFEEIRRVLRPKGQVRIYQHTAFSAPLGRRVQRVVDACGWPILFHGCRTSIDVVTLVQQNGFSWTYHRFGWYARSIFFFPTAKYVLGTCVPVHAQKCYISESPDPDI